MPTRQKTTRKGPDHHWIRSTLRTPLGAARIRGIYKGRLGGARRNRTADLLNAIQALSQLSYGPTGVQA